MVETEKDAGKLFAVRATDKDGDSVRAEKTSTEVWLTVQGVDGDYRQVRLSHSDAREFSAGMAELVSP
ncbi:hypothetical protein [Rhodococcus pyridinivorans]|uniref:hypothetical protein n=1 Tax=Rhodococcus pyridinivorans TaxID=103816 RepID=UPI00265B0742|nr:hypothetical protein [Rhodococcus pyridinivorans]